VENRPLEKLVLPVKKSLRWRLPGRFRAGGRTGHDAPPGAAATGQRKGHRASAPAHRGCEERL